LCQARDHPLVPAARNGLPLTCVTARRIPRRSGVTFVNRRGEDVLVKLVDPTGRMVAVDNRAQARVRALPAQMNSGRSIAGHSTGDGKLCVVAASARCGSLRLTCVSLSHIYIGLSNVGHDGFSGGEVPL